MPGRTGSGTPQAPRSGARGCRFCLPSCNVTRAPRALLRQAKLGAPRLLEPVWSGMAGWDVCGRHTLWGQDVGQGPAPGRHLPSEAGNAAAISASAMEPTGRDPLGGLGAKPDSATGPLAGDAHIARPAGVIGVLLGTWPSGRQHVFFDRHRDPARMRHARPTLPALTVNRQFMSEFVAAEAPCLALGLVEVEGSQCALVALHLNQTLPPEVSAAGFAFGHALFGGESWEVVHFAFEFYGFATYNVLINPSDPVARLVLNTMVETGDYFFFALTGNHRVTAFRSAIAKDNLAGLKANMARLQGSTTSDAQYRQAASQFEKRPVPPGTLLTWVCREDTGYLDLAQDPLVLSPA